MTANEKKQLMVNACKVRIGAIEGVHAAKAGHPGGSLSAADMFTYLYCKELNVDPKNPKYTQLIAENQTVPYTEIPDLSVFTNGKTDLAVGEETVSFNNNYLALHTSASLKGLTVVDYRVTQSGDDKGAITLTCEKDGVRINIRTIVLYENGALVTPDRFAGKTIDVFGVVDSYTPEGSTEAQIQVRVFTVGAITIH